MVEVLRESLSLTSFLVSHSFLSMAVPLLSSSYLERLQKYSMSVFEHSPLLIISLNLSKALHKYISLNLVIPPPFIMSAISYKGSLEGLDVAEYTDLSPKQQSKQLKGIYTYDAIYEDVVSINHLVGTKP